MNCIHALRWSNCKLNLQIINIWDEKKRKHWSDKISSWKSESLFTGRLFRQLVDLFQFYVTFPINDYDSEPISDQEMVAAHYAQVQQLQFLLYYKHKIVQELAMQNCGSVANRKSFLEQISQLKHEELKNLVCRELRYQFFDVVHHFLPSKAYDSYHWEVHHFGCMRRGKVLGKIKGLTKLWSLFFNNSETEINMCIFQKQLTYDNCWDVPGFSKFSKPNQIPNIHCMQNSFSPSLIKGPLLSYIYWNVIANLKIRGTSL